MLQKSHNSTVKKAHQMIIHQSGGKYQPFSTSVRPIIVLVCVTDET